MCKKIDHFPEDADYEADAAEYLLRKFDANTSTTHTHTFQDSLIYTVKGPNLEVWKIWDKVKEHISVSL